MAGIKPPVRRHIPDGQGICHQVVNELGITLRKAVCCSKRRRLNDGGSGTCQLKLVQDVLWNFIIRKPGAVVVDSDPLPECFMH